MGFKSNLSRPRTSLEAYFNSRFCLSQSRTSLEAYIDLQMQYSSEVVVYDSNATLAARLLCAGRIQKKGAVTQGLYVLYHEPERGYSTNYSSSSCSSTKGWDSWELNMEERKFKRDNLEVIEV
jgi:hypothetical protein